MSSTTYTDCRGDRWLSIPVRPGWTSFRIWVDPVADERARAVRDINRTLSGELPCQCGRCRTDFRREKLSSISPIRFRLNRMYDISKVDDRPGRQQDAQHSHHP
jgi:hypothetical protein